MTKRVHRGPDNKYHVGGKAYKHLVGSRRQVYEGFAYKTTGNLCKEDLVRSKTGRYVSLKKHKSAVAERRLNKYGYTAIKGKFGAVRMTAVQKTARAARAATAAASGATRSARKARGKKCVCVTSGGAPTDAAADVPQQVK